jgi:glycosyltransferase involved in cell wall biosynthesis
MTIHNSQRPNSNQSNSRSLKPQKIQDGVSILIVCHNEIANIENLIESLLRQSSRRSIKDVLVADNGSTDGSIEILQAIANEKTLPLDVWQRQQNNIGAARQQLVDSSNSDWVVFLDADCVPPRDWLRDLLLKAESCRQHDNFFAGCGAGHHLPGKNRMQQAVNSLMKHTPLHGFSSQAYDGDDVGRLVDHLPTTNAVFSKAALMSVGSFSSKYSKVGEDLDVGLRLTEAGHNLYRFAQPSLQNDCASSVFQWARRMFRFGTAQGLVFGRRGGFTLAFLLLSLLVAIIGLVAPPVLALAGLALVFTSWLFANRVAKRSDVSLWAPAFQITALTAPSYFLGFLNGLTTKVWSSSG